MKMQQKKIGDIPLKWNSPMSRVAHVTCGLLICLSTGSFAANENAKLLTENRIENVSPDQVGKTITVTVSDAMGPVIGANVVVKGTTNGNISDMNGKVVLKDVPNNATLVISYIGYVTQEVKVGSQKSIHVTMAEDTQALSEVVVVGYGTLDKKQVTSAVTSLSADDLTVGVSGSDISTALQGKIGGLVMINNGDPNASTTFQLRGMTSVKAGKSPLIVIDGFPGGDIRSLNQSDIKSIDVLKDASAGAIYGTRAASGVILITTKNGANTDGKVKMTYNAELRKRQAFGKPKMLSAAEYVEHNVGIDYGDDVDWWDELLQKDNFSQKHNLTLEAGTEKAQIYTSLFYEDNDGISINNSRKDFGGRVNSNFKLFDDWLEIRANVDYRQADRNNNFPNFQQALRNNPTRSPYDPESETGLNVWTNESLDYNVVADARLSTYEGLDKWFKPEATIKLNIKAVPGLSVQQVVGYENRQWEYHYFRSKNHRDEINNSRKGYAKLEFSKTEFLTSEGFATYIKEFKGGHNLNVVGGYSYFEKNNENFYAENYNFPVDGVKYWDIGAGTYLSDGKAGMGSGKGITERLFSLFARANYSYQDKYMLMASIRHEGSSKFAVDNRWANFWALSAGWRISNEDFMKDIKWIDDLKVRFGYGVTGNNDFGSDYTANTLSSDQDWMLPNGQWAKSYGKSKNLNLQLGWEEKKEWDLGIDYAFLDNRLYGKFDYYRRKIDNMLYEIKVPQPPYPQGSMWKNIGSMESKGWEFEVGGDIIRSKDFTWSTNLNLSHNTAKILTMSGDKTYLSAAGFPSPGNPGDAHRLEAGTTIGSFYIYQFAGFDDKGNFLLYNKDGEVIPASDKVEQDRRYIGNYMPKVILGWNHTLVYKNWDLGINLRSWLDFDVYNTVDMYFGIQGVDNCNVLKEAYGKFDHIRGEKQQCDYYLQDGSFLKIDAITLGYTLPLRKYTKYVNQLRVYGTVHNVATITGYTGINPEVNVSGWDGGIDWFTGLYPQVRTYTLGIQVSF